MSAHANIVLTAPDPRGRFVEGFLFGAGILPGTLVSIKAGVAIRGGRHTWEPYNRDANGNRALIAVVREMSFLGRDKDTAYGDGEQAFIYYPNPGDELQVRVSAAGTGTGDSIAIGDLLIPVDGTGLLIKTTGSPEIEPFQAKEAVSDVVSTGTLVHCIFTGN